MGPAAPQRASVFGEELVLWRDAVGRAQAFTDRCPHRGARLSMGRVHEGRLECPYHGWRFAADGACTFIPALPEFNPPATLRACRWPLREQHGLLWVAGAEALATAPHAPDDLQGTPARRILCGPFEVATSAPRVVENFLDTAHFGLVHEGWLGDRQQLAVPDYRVQADAHGRPGVAHYRAWQPRASSGAAAGAWVDYRYQVLSPYSALLAKRAETGEAAEAYALWCCPLDEESSRVWFTICTDESERCEAEMLAFQATIFGQDAPVLESQRPRRLPLSGGELHSAADRLSVAYRRWMQAQGVAFGTC